MTRRASLPWRDEGGSAVLLWAGLGILLLLSLLSLYRGLSRELPFWTGAGALLLILDVSLWAGYSPSAAGRGIRQALARTVPLPGPPEAPSELYLRPFPPRLSWNWAALILGPLWYFVYGLWVHGVILLALVFVSGGLFLPLAWLYAAVKANEDLQEFRIARKSVY